MDHRTMEKRLSATLVIVAAEVNDQERATYAAEAVSAARAYHKGVADAQDAYAKAQELAWEEEEIDRAEAILEASARENASG